MDYKFEVNERVIWDGSKVVTIISREAISDTAFYTVRVDGAHEAWTLMVNENRLAVALPARLMKCECGADSVLGLYNSFHADYCRKFVKHESLK